MRDSKFYTIFNSETETGVGKVISVTDYRHAVVSINTTGSANCTIKAQGAIADSLPDFSSARTASNSWEHIQLKDLQDGSSINGNTGFSVSGTDDNRLFEVNVNGLEYLAFNITAISAGAVTITLRVFED